MSLVKLKVAKACELCGFMRRGAVQYTTLQEPVRVVVLCRDVPACDVRAAMAKIVVLSTWII